jgi:cytochrome c oxidase subunit 2
MSQDLKLTLLQSMLNPSSEQAHRIYALFNYFNIAALGMLLLVTGLTIYICIKFSKRKTGNTIPSQTKGNSLVEALMIGVPTIIIIFFFFKSIAVMKSVEPQVDITAIPDVIITGHQWWWEVEYPRSKVISANEVHLPAGKKLLMELRSADVIHSWWVPQLGNKMDVIPGRNNYLTLAIEKAGKYEGTCSEFCGAEHAWMRIEVIAQDSLDFHNWLLANSITPGETSDDLSIRGKEVFQSSSCATCHRIDGTPAKGITGPDLTHLFSRNKMLGGLMEVNEANLHAWIKNPQEIKPGSYMPKFLFAKDSLDALVHYLSLLK